MEIVNLSAEPLGKLHGWLPHDLRAEKVVFLPDACPGKSPLPTGTAWTLRLLRNQISGDSPWAGVYQTGPLPPSIETRRSGPSTPFPFQRRK